METKRIPTIGWMAITLSLVALYMMSVVAAAAETFL